MFTGNELLWDERERNVEPERRIYLAVRLTLHYLHWCVIRVFTESSSNLPGIAFRTGWSLVIDFIQAAVAVAIFAFNVNLTCEWDFKQRYFEIQNLTCEWGSNIDCEDKLSQVDIQCDYNDCIDSVQSPRQTKVLQTHKKSIFGVANVAVLGILNIK